MVKLVPEKLAMLTESYLLERLLWYKTDGEKNIRHQMFLKMENMENIGASVAGHDVW